MGGWGGDDDAPPDPRRVAAAANLVRLNARIEQDVADRLAGRGFSSNVVRAYHAMAMAGLLDAPGMLRTEEVIVGSRFGAITFHEPPPAVDVPTLLDDACAEIARAIDRDFLHAAAYALWRLNWIHPFADGNGRTSRAVAYLIVGLGLGALPPGTPTLPEAIAQRRFDYQDALVAADRSVRTGPPDVSMMEELLHELLSRQMTNAS